MDQLELRTAGIPASLSTATRLLQDISKTVPITRVTTLADQVDSNIVPERLIATLSQLFTVLAGVGLRAVSFMLWLAVGYQPYSRPAAT